MVEKDLTNYREVVRIEEELWNFERDYKLTEKERGLLKEAKLAMQQLRSICYSHKTGMNINDL